MQSTINEVKTLVNNIKSRRRGMVGPAKDALREKSMQSEISGFDGLSFGAGQEGIHGAAGPDIMHLMDEGLVEWAIFFILKMVEAANMAGVAALDSRVMRVSTRHNDASFQTYKFRNGASNTEFPNARERVSALQKERIPSITLWFSQISLLMQILLCLGNVPGKFLPKGLLINVHSWATSFISLRYEMEERPMPLWKHAKLQKRIVKSMHEMKSLFIQYSPSKFKFIKYHMVMHVPWQIERFGNLHILIQILFFKFCYLHVFFVFVRTISAYMPCISKFYNFFFFFISA